MHSFDDGESDEDSAVDVPYGYKYGRWIVVLVVGILNGTISCQCNHAYSTSHQLYELARAKDVAHSA